MNLDPSLSARNSDHFGVETKLVRVLAPGGWRIDHGPGWRIVAQGADCVDVGWSTGADCWLIESGVPVEIPVDALVRSGLPVVVVAGADVPAALVDLGDGFAFDDDDGAVLGVVFGAAVAPPAQFGVRDLSDGTARTINALSAETSRIADALARLAEAQVRGQATERPVDAALVRRLLRVRRDRDRFFPAEIFADPAWDMLLDLTAARLEGKPVPVSSLCIAAAVPTTTALRWVRSLTEAGLFERRTDPVDARRSYISLSGTAATAMLAYLRGFGEQFSMR